MGQQMNIKRRRATGLLLAGAAAAGLGGWRGALGAGERVVVLTSYPEELVGRFQQAYEARHPGRRVEILWRQSADALAYLRRGGQQEVDVYWTPAPRNFALLKAEGRLAPLQLDTAALPSRVAGYPISDPDGQFAAFELAGYGIAYNRTALGRLGLTPPRDWRDLADPRYRGQVELPIPGRVGFAPVLIEAVLQGYGWDEGWAVLAAIAANAEFGSGDSNPGTDDLVSGRRAARLTIDFFAAAARSSGASVSFIYPPRTAYNPAQVAILAGAPHPAAARDFVEFLLSAEGQELLLHSDVHRLPVRKALYEAHPELSAQPFAPGNLAYSDVLTRSRQGLVAALFELALVQPHGRAVPLWQALHRAEAAGADPAVTAEARALLSACPVPDAQQVDGELRRLFDFPDRVPGQPEPPPVPARLAREAEWRNRVEAAQARAGKLLQAWRS